MQMIPTSSTNSLEIVHAKLHAYVIVVEKLYNLFDATVLIVAFIFN